MKQCSICKANKNISDFHVRSNRAAGTSSSCKICVSEKEKIRYRKKRDYILARVQEYNEKNRDLINENQRAYYSKNKETIAEYHKENRDLTNEYRRKRLSECPVLNIQDRLRRRTTYAFKIMGYTKPGKTETLLGASWQTVKTHIESQFKIGMSWDNRGQWEIDHIVPYASAKTVDDVIKLTHYKNLQPLWKSENRSKAGKL